MKPSLEAHYTDTYYAHFADTSRRSADVLLPLAVSQLRSRPASVLDLGCGVGAWLAAWRALDVQTVHGIDGPWVQRDQLQIPPEYFEAHDLSTPYTPTRRFDLAMSVEVAEHLPETAAAPLVAALTAAAPVVLFSASVPDMAGEHHVNCQWPAWWARLFRERGYHCVDSLRSMIWTDERIDWWYRQDIMWFVQSTDSLNGSPDAADPLPLIHPLMLRDMRDWGVEQERKYWELWKRLPPAGSQAGGS